MRYLPAQWVADLMGCGKATVYERMNEGMPHRMLGGLLRFREDEVLAWLEERYPKIQKGQEPK